jgi:serine/threonine protein phosphatase PrpC
VEGTGDLEEGASSNEDDRGLMATLKQEDVLAMTETGGRKFSVGSGIDAGKQSFGNKKVDMAGDEFDPASIGLGYTCRKGLKPESPNQDSWCVLKMEDFSIYGVFDGHGQKGHEVSLFVKDALPKLIIRDSRFQKGGGEVGSVLFDAFKKIQSLIATKDQMKEFEAKLSGTTATVAVHDHTTNKLTLAHVADSTCVMGESQGDEMKAVQLTRDHKPDLKDERARIEKAGGRVVFDGYANHRVYAKNGRYPGLNMSRCLGDLLGHQDCGVSCEPEINEVTITQQHQILLLCSDGVWEFMKPDEAVNLVKAFPAAQAMTAAERLAKEAWDRWIKEEGGAVVDDITVVLLYLNQKPVG